MYSHSRKIRVRIIQQRFLLNKWSIFKTKFSALDEAQVELSVTDKPGKQNFATKLKFSQSSAT